MRWSVAAAAAGVPVRATASYLSAVFDAQAEAFDEELQRLEYDVPQQALWLGLGLGLGG